MEEYTWKFVQTGRIKKKIAFYLCLENKVIGSPLTDANIAYQREQAMIKNGKTFKISFNDFLEDQKNLIAASWNRENFIPKVRVMDQKSFNAFLRGDK